MGTIEHRSKNSWRIGVQVKTPDGWEWVRVPLRMDPSLSEEVQRRDAERALKRLEAALADDSARMTLRQWSEEWLTKHVGPDCSPVTVHNYRYLLASRILPTLGDYALVDLTPAVLTDWLIGVRSSPRRSTRKPDDQLAHPRAKGERLIPPSQASRPLSVSTVQHYYTCMVDMLSAAVRVGYLEHNPMDRVQRPKQRRKKVDTISEAEAAALISDLDEQPNRFLRLAVLLALLCGLRLGEVVALRYADIDWQADTITVSHAAKYTPERGSFDDVPKTASSDRTIALPPRMRAILREAMWDDVQQYTDDPDTWHTKHHTTYIVHNGHGLQLHHDTPSKWFRAYADAHGFPGLRFHDLRHAHASILVAHNIDVAAVAARMGHSDAGITLRTYAHAMAQRDTEAAATLDALLPAAQ